MTILKTQTVTKLKKLKIGRKKNSKCDKTQKLNMWQNSKTNYVTKLTNSECDKTQICGKTQNFKMLQNSKTQNVAQLKNSRCD